MLIRGPCYSLDKQCAFTFNLILLLLISNNQAKTMIKTDFLKKVG